MCPLWFSQLEKLMEQSSSTRTQGSELITINAVLMVPRSLFCLFGAEGLA